MRARREVELGVPLPGVCECNLNLFKAPRGEGDGARRLSPTARARVLAANALDLEARSRARSVSAVLRVGLRAPLRRSAVRTPTPRADDESPHARLASGFNLSDDDRQRAPPGERTRHRTVASPHHLTTSPLARQLYEFGAALFEARLREHLPHLLARRSSSSASSTAARGGGGGATDDESAAAAARGTSADAAAAAAAVGFSCCGGETMCSLFGDGVAVGAKHALARAPPGGGVGSGDGLFGGGAEPGHVLAVPLDEYVATSQYHERVATGAHHSCHRPCPRVAPPPPPPPPRRGRRQQRHRRIEEGTSSSSEPSSLSSVSAAGDGARAQQPAAMLGCAARGRMRIARRLGAPWRRCLALLRMMPLFSGSDGGGGPLQALRDVRALPWGETLQRLGRYAVGRSSRGASMLPGR